MSTPLKQVKYVALLACLAWALSLVVASAAPAHDDHHGPDAAQHQQEKPAKDADKAAEQAQKDADKATEQAQKGAEKAAKEADKAQKDAEHAAKEKGKHGKSETAPVVFVVAPSAAPQQEALGQKLKACTSRRRLTIHLRRQRGVHYRSATVTLNGRRIATRHGKRITAPIDLRGLAKGTYHLVIRVTTTKGKVLRGTRTYHTCVGPRPHRAPKL